MLPILFLLFCQDAKPIDLATLESEIIKARNSIKSGEIEITSVIKKYQKNGSPQSDAEYKYLLKLAMSGEKLRSEYAYSIGGEKQGRIVGILNCEKHGYYFTYDDHEKSADAQFAPFDSADKLRKSTVLMHHTVPFHFLGTEPLPLVLGLLDESETVFSNRFLDKANYSIIIEGSGDNKKYIFKGRNQSNTKNWDDPFSVTVVVFPNKGWNITSIRQENSKSNITVDIDLLEVNNIWFPSKFIYKRFQDNVLQEEEAATIRIQSLNSTLSEKLFSREGVDLKHGTVLREGKDLFYWIDNKMVPYRDYWKKKKNNVNPLPEISASIENTNAWNWFFVTFSGIFFILGILFIFIWGK